MQVDNESPLRVESTKDSKPTDKSAAQMGPKVTQT